MACRLLHALRAATLSLLLAAFAPLPAQTNAPAAAAAPAAAPAAAQATAPAPEGRRNFSFVQVSDIHVSPAFSVPSSFSGLRSYPCMSTLKDLGEMSLQPYGVTAPKPSFILGTGDITEFSYPGVTWEVVMKYFEGVGCRVFLVPGNHDNTWVASTKGYRQYFGGQNYSFDYEGCHFIGLASPTLQDPSPSYGEEVLRFVKADLERTGPTTPVFIFFHHPLKGSEYASRYDVDRLLDILRPYNVVLTLDGHGHGAVKHNDFQIDGVEGGSPFSKEPGNEGYNIISVNGDRLCVAYRKCGEAEATKALLDKTIPDRSNYPEIEIQSPAAGQLMTDMTLTVTARVKSPPRPIVSARYSIDDDKEGELRYGNNQAFASFDVSDLANGAHFIRVSFINNKGGEYTKSEPFFIEPAKGPGKATALWRAQLGGASKATPLVLNGTVYLGTNDGRFYALDAKTGAVKWTFEAGGEILTAAAAHDGLLFFGDGNGLFHALDTQGKEVWKYDAGSEIFSSPAIDSTTGAIYFGTNAAHLIALRAKDGQPVWINKDAQYGVESKPFVANGKVCYGAWDGYVYAVDAMNGATIWKKAGPKNQDRVITYYGPADNGPVMTADGKAFICDRGYAAGRYGPAGEYEKTFSQDVSALALGSDGQSLILRGLKTPITKANLDGGAIWTSSVVAGRIPASPTVHNGKVYVCTNTGRLAVLNEADGQTLWEYQVTPKLFVMAGVGVDDEGTAYTVGLDGVVTAVRGFAN